MLTIDKLDEIFQDFPVPALILAANKDFKILQANQAYIGTLAMPPEELYGRPLFEVFPDQHPEDPESPIKKTIQCIQKAIQLKTPQTPGTIPYRIPDENGGYNLRFWMLDYIPVEDDRGNVAYIFQLTHEIVEHQLTDKLQSATTGIPYERMFDTAQNAFFLSGRNGEVLAVNRKACTMFGYSEEELKRLRRQDLLVPDPNIEPLLAQREREGRTSGEAVAITKNGEQFPCEFSSVRFITITGEQQYCTEITDTRKWKNAEEKVRQSEENLRAIFDNTVEGFVLVDNTLKIIAFNDKAGEVILQYVGKKEVTVGSSLLEYLAPERQVAFQGIAARVIKGERIEYERPYPLPHGKIRWFIFAVNPVYENDSVIGLCISGRDITMQKLAEEEVLRREKLFRRMVENSADAILIMTAEGKVTYVSPAGEQITGYTAGETMQMNAFDTIHPDDRAKSTETMSQVFANPGLPINAAPLRLQHKNGSWRWIEATLTNFLHDPEINGIIENFRDVTKRIESEQKILLAKHEAEQSEEKYRKIFNLSPLPIWIYSLDNLRILEVNDAAIKHYGYSREEFLSMTIMDIRPPEDAAPLKELLNNIQKDRQTPPNHWRHIKKNGEVIIVEITGHSIDFYGPNARIIICRDVTETIRTGAELLRSNERFRQAARAASDAIWDWETATDTVFLGEGFSTLFGYEEAGKTVSRNWVTDKIHPDDRLKVSTRIQEVIKGTRRARWQDEYRFQKADGSYAMVCNSVVIVHDENNKPLRAIGAMKDITHQKEEEQHLRQLESVITNTTDAVLIITVGQHAPHVIYANPAFYKNNGYTTEEVKTHGFALFHGPNTDIAELAKLEKAIKNHESCQIQAVFYKKNGEPYWASLAISPVVDDKGNVKNYIAIERDITERMNYLTAIEEQNKQLREIAWVQSHMVRAPLASILGLTDLLINEIKEPTSSEALDMLKKSANDLDNVIREIVQKTASANK
ncbi:PAS domain S-box protein [Mucilaginibacter ximonensis]|uniref:histidine kinase n=1 Tax=Mucilaginibacter ximonensis TaxID=538021 RepID=A0ABW5YBJ3_9SPHI